MRVEVTLVDTATVRMKALPEQTRARLRVVLVRDGKELAARVRGKLSGSLLKVCSGRLLRSIKTEMVENPYAIYGRVYSSGVPYAGILEHGGQTRPHDIYPRNVRALHFMMGGREVFAAVVHHPGSKIPAFRYLGGTLDEMRSHIVADIQDAGRPRWA